YDTVHYHAYIATCIHHLFHYTTLFRSYPNLVSDRKWWLKMHRRAIHRLLRLVQGEWPPGSAPSPWLSKLRAHLEQLRYCADHIPDRKSTRLNSSHVSISYDVFCFKKKI